MALPLLNDLRNELERLYIAGSALALDDPRVKRHLPALQKLGERAPVFRNLADRLAALTETEASPENLMEAGTMLYSILYSQGRTDNGCTLKPFAYSETPLAITQTRFSQRDRKEIL